MKNELEDIHIEESEIITWTAQALRLGTNRYVEALIADLLEAELYSVPTVIPSNFDPADAVEIFLTSHDENLSSRAFVHLRIALTKSSGSTNLQRQETYDAVYRALLHHEDHEVNIRKELRMIFNSRLKQLNQLLSEAAKGVLVGIAA